MNVKQNHMHLMSLPKKYKLFGIASVNHMDQQSCVGNSIAGLLVDIGIKWYGVLKGELGIWGSSGKSGLHTTSRLPCGTSDMVPVIP